MRWRTWASRFATVVVLAVTAPAAAAVDERPGEYDVKGAFLFHFARLTDWPEAALPAGEPFIIAILGHDPFGATLDQMLEGQEAHGRALQIHRSLTVADLPDRANIVFISRSEQPFMATILSRFKGRPVLTVSETDGFGDKGGMVNFVVTPDARVRFEVNVREAETSGLKVSSQVLKLARIVGPPP